MQKEMMFKKVMALRAKGLTRSEIRRHFEGPPKKRFAKFSDSTRYHLIASGCSVGSINRAQSSVRRHQL